MVGLVMETSNKGSELIINRKGGGSVIDRRPVFSDDGRVLFVVWGPVIRSYSVQTGELINSFEGLSSKAIGVMLNPANPDHIVACSQEGELAEWNWKKVEMYRKVQLYLKYEADKHEIVSGFHLTLSKGEKCKLCVIWGYKGETYVTVEAFNFISGRKSKRKLKYCRFDSHSHSVAINDIDGETIIAGIKQNELQVTFTESNHFVRKFIGGGRWFTCVACHPNEACIATGDNSGRMLVWRGLTSGENPVYGVYHWHTLPVTDIAFSNAGSYVYSGGGEGVLVKWTLDVSNQRAFLPRLPASIAHVSLAAENQCIAISTQDNAIQVVDPQFKHISVIQHFTWGVRPIATAPARQVPLFPAGLTRDPRTQSLVLNGRTGHIQFFSMHSKMLLYNLDITGQNYLSQERGTFIVNTEVIKIAFSCDGHWLATVEQRADEEMSPELRLKFWMYDDLKQMFVLNTSIDLPHKSTVYALQFRPTSIPEQLLAVTTGDDFKFRVWGLSDNSSIYKKGVAWFCESVGFYRNLPAGDLSFSADGSLLAVAFGSTLTVWVTETNELRCCLTQAAQQNDISHVEFGQQDCEHLIIAGTASGISVWNIITTSVSWIVPFNLSIMTSDPKSNLIAAISSDNDLVVFCPNYPQPVFKKSSIAKSKILAAVFVPHLSNNPSYSSWQTASQLYFLDSDQELLALEDEGSAKEHLELDVVPSSSNLPQTPFSALIAQQSNSGVQEACKDQHIQLGNRGDRVVSELLKAPAHTMPPVSLLCGSFLRSLIATKSSITEEKGSSNIASEYNEIETQDSGVDSDESEASFIQELVPKQVERMLTDSEKSTEILKQERVLQDIEAKLEPILNENCSWSFVLLQRK